MANLIVFLFFLPIIVVAWSCLLLDLDPIILLFIPLYFGVFVLLSCLSDRYIRKWEENPTEYFAGCKWDIHPWQFFDRKSKTPIFPVSSHIIREVDSLIKSKIGDRIIRVCPCCGCVEEWILDFTGCISISDPPTSRWEIISINSYPELNALFKDNYKYSNINEFHISKPIPLKNSNVNEECHM